MVVNLLLAGAMLLAIVLLSHSINRRLRKRYEGFQFERRKNASHHPKAFTDPPPTTLGYPDTATVEVFDLRLCVRIGACSMRSMRDCIELFSGFEPESHSNCLNDIPVTGDHILLLQEKGFDGQFIEMLTCGIPEDAGFIVLRWRLAQSGG